MREFTILLSSYPTADVKSTVKCKFLSSPLLFLMTVIAFTRFRNALTGFVLLPIAGIKKNSNFFKKLTKCRVWFAVKFLTRKLLVLYKKWLVLHAIFTHPCGVDNREEFLRLLSYVLLPCDYHNLYCYKN